jgi:hypothetical protein
MTHMEMGWIGKGGVLHREMDHLTRYAIMSYDFCIVQELPTTNTEIRKRSWILTKA